MARQPITRADVAGRSRVGDLVESSPRQALKTARSIKHPWYRCQSLSTVAEHWGTRKQKLEVLDEAFSAANEQDSVNRIVTVSAWPIRVLVALDPEKARPHLEKLLELADTEPHSLRRAQALFALAAALGDNTRLLDIVLPSLHRALMHGRGWRIDRLIRWSVEITKAWSAEETRQLILHHSDGAKKSRLMREHGLL